MADFAQFAFAGLTTGAIYALVALGFAIVYNASGVINFAQGDFLMLGGMLTAAMLGAGLPSIIAIPLAVAATALSGAAIQKFAIARAKTSDAVTLIIITIGVSTAIQGLVEITLGKNQHSLPSFSGDAPLSIFGALVLPQSLWVLAIATALFALVGAFFRFTVVGKAMLAVSYDRMAAELVGVDARKILLLSFSLAALLGAGAGVASAPITTTSFDLGQMLGMKGYVAATLGGLGSGLGAVIGGLLVGLLEALVSGYLSSAYKDAVPFLVIIPVLLVLPHGLFGSRTTDRV